MEEKWLPIPEEKLSHLYEISSHGRIRSKNKVLAQFKKGGTGYWMIGIRNKDFRRTFTVHRLVAKAFVPMIEGCNIVNHIDSNPLNNIYTNLEWTTTQGNLEHQRINKNFAKGESHGMYKIDPKKAIELRDKGLTREEIGKHFGCTGEAIGACLRRVGYPIDGPILNLSPEDVKVAGEMRMAGKSFVEIAKYFGVSKFCISDSLKRNNIFNPEARTFKKKVNVTEAIQMYQNGKSLTEIAKFFETKASVIHYHVNKNKVT